MPDEQQPETPVFEEYACSLGTVINHEAGSYIIRTPDGRVIGIAGNGELSAANIESDIASPSLTNRKSALLTRAAQRRWEREVGGLVLEGVTIRTDRESQAMLNGAITFCDLESQAVVNWKAANGWQQLGEMGLRAIALAVGRHVQACFSRERELGELIDAATTQQQLDDIAAAIEAFDL